MKKRWAALALAAAGLIAASGAAMAAVNVGVTISATGPAASLGIPQKNTIALMPHTIAGEKINYIVLDDASDTTAGVTNTRKLISENNVDIILGSSTTPVSLAMTTISNTRPTSASSPSVTVIPALRSCSFSRTIAPICSEYRAVVGTYSRTLMSPIPDTGSGL